MIEYIIESKTISFTIKLEFTMFLIYVKITCAFSLNFIYKLLKSILKK